MKSKALLFLLLITTSMGLKAQDTDQQIGTLLSQSDWFALDEIFHQEKEKIQSPTLKILAETILSAHFNEPEKALTGIDTLLTNHQGELGFDNICSMVMLKSAILGEQGRYAESADNMNHFLDQIKGLVNMDDFKSYEKVAKLYDRIRNEPKPEIIRPDKDVEIPIYIESEGKGSVMFVPVIIKKKEYRFILDTGASSTFVSKRLADEIGLRIVRDSLEITGIETEIGESGTIDSLQIGEIIFKHPIVIIAPPNPTIDTIYQFDAILGLDFIKRIGETQIFPKEGKVVFPKNQTSLPQGGRNLFIQYEQPYIKVLSDKERLIFHFDTGNASIANLYKPYFLKHYEQIMSSGIKDSVHVGGFGGIRKSEIYKLPNFPLNIGSVNFEVKNIPVHTDSVGKNQNMEDGSLGSDFIQLIKKVTINFNKMFVEVEE